MDVMVNTTAHPDCVWPARDPKVTTIAEMCGSAAGVLDSFRVWVVYIAAVVAYAVMMR